jgi:HD-GYP domain-containing protein (c-di-GMP phosphodiesterase class II)
MDAARAAAILRAGRGTQWAPELVDALLAALGHERAPEPRAEALASAPRPH